MTQWEEIIYDTLENYYIEMITWELRNYEISNKDTTQTRTFKNYLTSFHSVGFYRYFLEVLFDFKVRRSQSSSFIQQETSKFRMQRILQRTPVVDHRGICVHYNIPNKFSCVLMYSIL